MLQRRRASWILVTALLLSGAVSCAPADDPPAPTSWNPPQRLVATNWYNPGQYSLSNASGEHAAVASAASELPGSWQLGVHELGSTVWSRLVSLPFPDPSVLYFPRVLVDAKGDLTLVASKIIGDDTVEHQMVKRTSGAWGTVIGLHKPFPINQDPKPPNRYRYDAATAVAVDDLGRGLIAWSQPVDLSTVEIWAVLFADDAGTPIRLRTLSSAALPALHVTANHDGTRFVAWHEADASFIAKWDGSSWSLPKQLPIDTVTAFGRDVALLSTEGSQAQLFTYSNAALRVRTYRWDGERLTATEDLDALSGPLDSISPEGTSLRAAIAADGTLAAAWNRREGGHTTRLYIDGQWSESRAWKGSLHSVHVASRDEAAILLSEYIEQAPSAVQVQQWKRGSWQPRQTVGSGYYLQSLRLSRNRQGSWLAFWWQAETASLAHPMSLWGAVSSPL